MPPECATRYFASESAWQRELLPYQTQMQADVAALLPADVRSVLDAGCGNGVIANALPESLEVTGLDMSRTALTHVTRDSVAGSVLDLPFADGAFDLVMCNDVLEHLNTAQRRQAAAELTRVARRYVLVSLPFREDLLQSATACHLCGGWYHVNHHTDSFDAADVRGMFAEQPLECLSHTLSGDVWWRDPPASVALRRLTGLERAPTAAPVCPYCGCTETAADDKNTRLSQTVDWLAAAQCMMQPELFDHATTRTEIITLFRKSEERVGVERKPDGGTPTRCDWRLIDEDGERISAAEITVRNDRIDFRRAHVYRQPFAPRYGWLPYFTTSADDEPQILRPDDRLLCGFFVGEETRRGKEARCLRKAGLRIRGRATGRCRLSVSRFNDPRRSLIPKRFSVDGSFEVSCRCRPVLTRYGYLFILQSRGGAIELESVTLDAGRREERTLIDNRTGRVRFLVNNSSPQLQVSLPLYGDAIDVEQVIRSADAPTQKPQPIPVDAEQATMRVRESLRQLRPLTQRPGTPSHYRRAIR
ncbi:MAG: class I SAM-dependent methyltransferase [Planctomycetaceae bacterium]